MFGFVPMISKDFFDAVKAPLFVTLGIFGVLLLLAVVFTACELRSGKRQKKQKG